MSRNQAARSEPTAPSLESSMKSKSCTGIDDKADVQFRRSKKRRIRRLRGVNPHSDDEGVNHVSKLAGRSGDSRRDEQDRQKKDNPDKTPVGSRPSNTDARGHGTTAQNQDAQHPPNDGGPQILSSHRAELDTGRARSENPNETPLGPRHQTGDGTSRCRRGRGRKSDNRKALPLGPRRKNNDHVALKRDDSGINIRGRAPEQNAFTENASSGPCGPEDDTSAHPTHDDEYQKAKERSAAIYADAYNSRPRRYEPASCRGMTDTANNPPVHEPHKEDFRDAHEAHAVDRDDKRRQYEDASMHIDTLNRRPRRNNQGSHRDIAEPNSPPVSQQYDDRPAHVVRGARELLDTYSPRYENPNHAPIGRRYEDEREYGASHRGRYYRHDNRRRDRDDYEGRGRRADPYPRRDENPNHTPLGHRYDERRHGAGGRAWYDDRRGRRMLDSYPGTVEQREGNQTYEPDRHRSRSPRHEASQRYRSPTRSLPARRRYESYRPGDDRNHPRTEPCQGGPPPPPPPPPGPPPPEAFGRQGRNRCRGNRNEESWYRTPSRSRPPRRSLNEVKNSYLDCPRGFGRKQISFQGQVSNSEYQGNRERNTEAEAHRIEEEKKRIEQEKKERNEGLEQLNKAKDKGLMPPPPKPDHPRKNLLDLAKAERLKTKNRYKKLGLVELERMMLERGMNVKRGDSKKDLIDQLVKDDQAWSMIEDKEYKKLTPTKARWECQRRGIGLKGKTKDELVQALEEDDEKMEGGRKERNHWDDKKHARKSFDHLYNEAEDYLMPDEYRTTATEEQLARWVACHDYWSYLGNDHRKHVIMTKFPGKMKSTASKLAEDAFLSTAYWKKAIIKEANMDGMAEEALKYKAEEMGVKTEGIDDVFGFVWAMELKKRGVGETQDNPIDPLDDLDVAPDDQYALDVAPLSPDSVKRSRGDDEDDISDSCGRRIKV
ncbi:hypothetical protein K469DRAFT_695209 [Zopfia rhizophila CBS 207.26]|uniref:Uncharacterized protein n=1 Tax=Zopfia rhizophila CBS 207.26 TaxID=1314779 RepID=A0A6A6DLS9_9PEZI|nr:hypothetical protein K469DRAFT_695209 [Zopfia rhizophila CBS 207.26]